MSKAAWLMRSIIGLGVLLAVACDSTPPKPPPATGCTISGTDYADGMVNPNDPCQSCQLAVSATAWTNLADGLLCNQGNSVCTNGACRSGCYINMVFYSAPDTDPMNSCKICHPAETTQAWSDLPTGSPCADGGVCTGGSCQVGCFIQGLVYPDHSDNAEDPSLCCNQKGNPTSWSSRLVAANSYDLGGTGTDIVSADFNGDGADDLAAIDQAHDWVSVLLSDGNGGFMPAQTFPTESAPRALATTDLNGDGKPDLVVASSGQKTLDVLINQGGGSFAAFVSYPAGTGLPGSMTTGDFDSDGKKDVLCSEWEDGLVFFPGLGDGHLLAGIPVFDGGESTVASGSLVGTALDVVTADPDAGLINLIPGIGDGGYSASATYPPPTPPLDVAVGRFNADALLDIAFSTPVDAQIFINSGGGQFAGPFLFPVTQAPGGLGVADLNGAGFQSLLVSAGGVGVAGAFGDAGTQQVAPLVTLSGATGRMAVGDFNGDHAPDVAVLSGTGISVFLNGCP